MSQGSPTEAFGPYLVYEQLGVGGMAQVHRAVAANSEVQRPVALKRMLSHIAGSEDMVKSFVREARLASYLRHENVAQTYDLGRVGDIYFIVMELITGRNLREVLRHCGSTTGPMPVPIALNILNQICDALDYAHNLCDETGEPLGIIHRDVSPSNVIVSDSGVVKLIDFGIAKASGAGMQTMGGTLKGKFGYMAPEYIAGRIDARADLFAVGVIAHELLTNRPLFSGRDDIDTLTRVRDMHIQPPSAKNPQVPPEIDDVVMTALQRDPDRRWQHATALRSALTTLTHRLGLVASNTQVIQWLDWAFVQPARPHRRAQADARAERAPASDEPSISIERHTAQLSSSSQRLTLMMTDGEPAPPTKTPLGTPAYIPAQRAASSAVAGDRPADDHADALASRVGASAEIPPLVRSSASYARVPSSSAAPPLASYAARGHAPPGAGPIRAQAAPPAGVPPHRTQPASVPPPIAAATGRAHPASAPPAFAASPGLPSLNAAPFAAPRPAPLAPASPGPGPVVPAPPATAPRLGGAPATSDPGAGRGPSPVVAALLVVLAAAVAAAAVYFVLPLLT